MVQAHYDRRPEQHLARDLLIPFTALALILAGLGVTQVTIGGNK
jgi:hypothetical protein